MSRIQCAGQLPHDRPHVLTRGPLTTRRQITQPLLKSLPRQQLLHHVAQAVVLAEIVDLYNVGVVQAGDQPRLLLEAHGDIGLRRKIGQHLDRHRPSQITVEAAINTGHSADTKQRLNLVVAQLRADQLC